MAESKKSLFKAGAYVYIEGDEDSDEIYIVEKGEVELKSVNENAMRYKPLVGPGEVFGFTSALCRKPRMESAVARRDSVVITLKRERFIDMVQQNPEVALKIVNYFAEELRTYNEMMFTLGGEGPDILPDDLQLFNLGLHYYRKGDYAYAAHVLGRYLEGGPEGPAAEQARGALADIEKTERRSVSEPVRKGLYKVFADRQMIFSEFESGDELYIIKEGKVKITKIMNDQEIMLSVLKEGDIFGELAIVSNKPRNATAISWGKTELLPIGKDTLATVLRKSPGIINRIFMAISQRIWFTFIRLESRLYAKPITRIYVFLENKLLEERVPLKSTEPVTFNFGIDELLRMTGLPPAPPGDTMDLLLGDHNLTFNFGQTVVDDPSVLSTKAKFYRSRDHLSVDEEAAAPRRERRAEEQTPRERPAPEPPRREKAPLPTVDAEEVSSKAAAKKTQAEPAAGLSQDELRIPSEEIDLLGE